MKILVVADVLGKKNNGTTMAAYNLIESLQKRGHEVRVLCGDPDKVGVADYFVCPNIDFWIFNHYVQSNGINPAKADNNIINKALDGVDLVHIMLPFSVGNRTAKIANERHIPITTGFHIQAENVTSHFYAMKFTKLNPTVYKIFWNKLYRYADCIHFPTKFIKDDFEKVVGPTNGYVISNGVKAIFNKKEVERPEFMKDKYCILYTGRYSREKCQQLLINAVQYSKYKDKIQLVLAGDGPTRKKIEKLSTKLPIKPILGIHFQEELINIINSCDLYVHCAYAELESIAALEAISCGLVPIINNTKRTATKNFAIDEKDLFNCNDSKDLAKKIDYWIENPLEREKRSNEYLDFTKQFEFEHCMDRMEKMMKEAIEIRKYKTENNLVNRVISYKDPVNEDYACTDISNKKIKGDFLYVHKNKFWRMCSNIIYHIIAKPIVGLVAKVNRGVRVENKKVLKKLKKTGYFIYGNHTSKFDGVIPQTCLCKQKAYIIANSDAVSIPGIQNLVMMLGTIPVPSDPASAINFQNAIEKRYKQNRVIAIYPEAHIWPFCQIIRPFGETSFSYPAKLNAPLIAMVTVYRKQRHNSPLKSKPRATIILSEPIYPNPLFSQKENMKYLRDQVYDFMVKTSEKANKVDYISYVPCVEHSTRFEK